jgi:diphthamide biosynthesis protein 3
MGSDDENLSIYDEIEFEDLEFHDATKLYTYPCPCGDQFEISLSDLRNGEDIGVCPSCSLMIQVIFDASDLPKEEKEMKKDAEKVIKKEEKAQQVAVAA